MHSVVPVSFQTKKRKLHVTQWLDVVVGVAWRWARMVPTVGSPRGTSLPLLLVEGVEPQHLSPPQVWSVAQVQAGAPAQQVPVAQLPSRQPLWQDHLQPQWPPPRRRLLLPSPLRRACGTTGKPQPRHRPPAGGAGSSG